MNGREALRQMRRGGDWTPVILLTQVEGTAQRIMAIEEGADDYLNKPFDPQELVACIRAVVTEEEHWETINELLDEVDSRLDLVESGIEEVGQALTSQDEAFSPDPPQTDEPVIIQDGLDQVLTIFAALAGISGIVVALFLALALRVQDKTRVAHDESQRTDPPGAYTSRTREA